MLWARDIQFPRRETPDPQKRRRLPEIVQLAVAALLSGPSQGLVRAQLDTPVTAGVKEGKGKKRLVERALVERRCDLRVVCRWRALVRLWRGFTILRSGCVLWEGLLQS